MDIGTKIREIRKNNKLTQKEFAERIKVSEISIRKYESNQRNPSLEILTKISKEFNINLSELNQNNEYNEILNEYMKNTINSEDLLKEFLKCDVMQEECGYEYNSLMFQFDIDSIYLYIQDMLRIKIAKSQGDIKTDYTSSKPIESLENYIFTEGYDVRKFDNRTLMEIKRKFKDILELEYFKLGK
ncbi:helix-turn-helix transcriptional regulator [Clostridium botulinum]|nr:helix-turn-helix transcriptional regulator [Clostridium botulinum]